MPLHSARQSLFSDFTIDAMRIVDALRARGQSVDREIGSLLEDAANTR
jgi:hypothetical protein